MKKLSRCIIAMRYKNIFLLMVLLILVSGCVRQQAASQTPTLQDENICRQGEEICLIGNPGLLNQRSMYSGSFTSFSILLRNNLEGDQAENVKVELKNLSPFYVIEGYKLDNNFYKVGICFLTNGIWKPHEIRESIYVPEPQFISDFNLAFAQKMLDVMYPNEEVEFIWNLLAPTRHEIANVAYQHTIDYEISYDYKSSILQTIYAISEQEYQRALSIGEDISSKKGIMTASVGALEIKNNVEEPIRVTGPYSQFSINYEISNKRSGIPLTPALFLLQYPQGTDFIGKFDNKFSLNQLGFIDLNAAFEFYNSTDSLDSGLICLDKNFDNYDPIIKSIRDNAELLTQRNGGSELNETCLLYDELIDYISTNFKDLVFDRNSPNLVLKFLYPINLKNQRNYLYFPMITTENIDISKYYTFRLKTKYRYSFGGSDTIYIIPAEQFITPTYTEEVKFFGDMGFNQDIVADDYKLIDDTLKMTRDDEKYVINSTSFKLRGGEFLHYLEIQSNKPEATISCTSNNDCGEDNSCEDSICKTNELIPTTSTETLSIGAGFTNLNKYEFTLDKGESIAFDIEKEDVCDKGTFSFTSNIFLNLTEGNLSYYLISNDEKEPKNVLGTFSPTNLNTKGEYFAILSNLWVNCSGDAINTIILNSTFDGTKVEIIDAVIYNNTEILKEFDLSDMGGFSKENQDYYKILLNKDEQANLQFTGGIDKDDLIYHFINYKILLGGLNYRLNGIARNIINVPLTINSNFRYSSISGTANDDKDSFIIGFNSTQPQTLAYFKTDEYKLNEFEKTFFVSEKRDMKKINFYDLQVGYSPISLLLKKYYETTESIKMNIPTLYISNLKYKDYTDMEYERDNKNNHNFELGTSISQTRDNLHNFINFKSFFNLNEIEINEATQTFEKNNVFSENDFISVMPFSDSSNQIPLTMVSYYNNDSYFIKKVNEDNTNLDLLFIYFDYNNKLAIQ